MWYIPELMKKKVIVDTEIGEVKGLLIHLSQIVIVLINRRPVIIRDWETIKWLD